MQCDYGLNCMNIPSLHFIYLWLRRWQVRDIEMNNFVVIYSRSPHKTKCFSAVDDRLHVLKNPSTPISGSTIWLLTANDPSETNDIYRHMCIINTFGHGIILLDFLDLSYNGHVSRGNPYCVYWGESDFVCTRKASGRQTFEVRDSSGSKDSQLTLLFWSNNYTRMPTARFWIEIRGSCS